MPWPPDWIARLRDRNGSGRGPTTSIRRGWSCFGAPSNTRPAPGASKLPPEAADARWTPYDGAVRSDFHVRREPRERYAVKGSLLGIRGDLVLADTTGIRRLAA